MIFITARILQSDRDAGGPTPGGYGGGIGHEEVAELGFEPLAARRGATGVGVLGASTEFPLQ